MNLGTTAHIETTVYDEAGTATDPISISLTYRKPSGAETTVAFAALTDEPGAGVWSYDVVVDEPGVWTWRFSSTTPTVTDEGTFQVLPSAVAGGDPHGTGPCQPWCSLDDLTEGGWTLPTGASVFVAELACTAASEACFELGGRRWPGLCWDSVIPQSCLGGAGFVVIPNGRAGLQVVSGNRWGAHWVHQPFGCGGSDVIDLGSAQVTAIDAVRVDEVAVASTVYRLIDRRWLARIDGDSWPCFPAGTLVLTADGLRAIETIRSGEMVLTHRNRWRRVLRSGQTGESETVRVRGHGGELRCTPDHPVWSAEILQRRTEIGSERRKIGAPEWTDATNLVGRVWATPTDIAPLNVPFPRGWVHDTPDEVFWWSVGRWLGDGWVENARRVVICCGHHEAQKFAAKIGRTEWDWKPETGRTGVKFRMTMPSLAVWLTEHFGIGARDKTVPAWMFGAPEDVRRPFLAGYLSADGCRVTPARGRPLTSVHTVGRRLALGIRLVAASLGFAPSVHGYGEDDTPQTIEGRPVLASRRYLVNWTDLPAGERQSHTWADGEHLWGKVRSVDLDETVVPVYDLEVEDDHSFIADGFVVHNCCNDPSADPIALEVDFTFGEAPPALGVFAAVALARELVKGLVSGDDCAIDPRVTALVREGISLDLTDGGTDAESFLEIPAVRRFVATMNPHKIARAATVIVPGQGTVSHRV